MRTSLLIFVLAAFVHFVFAEAQSDDYDDPKFEEIVTQLTNLTQKVIDETKNSGVKDQLTEARPKYLHYVKEWKWAINRGMRSAIVSYNLINKRSQQLIKAASPENKGELLIKYFPSPDAKLRS
ncbi:uncharacterized protein [Periplaneta americana]|uniref:uncharacterized protein n=1 Tax=Periplaneta americana TaxID=6978 RepID=UPI0037E77633